jgi:hypothetical protein
LTPIFPLDITSAPAIMRKVWSMTCVSIANRYRPASVDPRLFESVDQLFDGAMIMIGEKQLDANRRNAQHSTGSGTAEGRAVSPPSEPVFTKQTHSGPPTISVVLDGYWTRIGRVQGLSDETMGETPVAR